MNKLKYRRYEWKCHNLNEASKSAALRFSFQFEGVLRSNLIQNGCARDTAYFSILDTEWPVIKQALQLWLDTNNFDINGTQRQNLRSIREYLKQQKQKQS